jgi:hypothetical protein
MLVSKPSVHSLSDYPSTAQKDLSLSCRFFS